MEKQLVRLFSREEIAAAVKRLAREIDRDSENRSPVVIGILKGSFIFIADLVRNLETPPLAIEFTRLSSYGSATVSSGRAEILAGLPEEAVRDRNVLVVEDIVDTGITTATLLEYLQSYRPSDLKLCTLLDKPSRRRVEVKIDYRGFTVPDRFIVGYGIDFDERYRQLPEIYTIEE